MQYYIILERGEMQMSNVIIRKNDQIMMSLVHYFVTKENYSPIRVQGANDEIWLENLNGPYRIIRISAHSIINEEQYKYDLFKINSIIRQIKKKTLSLKVNTLNICLDMSKRVDVNKAGNIETIRVDSLNDAKKNKDLKGVFPGIVNNLLETEDGLELIINVTNDINEKTEKENKKFEKVFAPKKIVWTKVIIVICLIMYIITAVYGGNWFSFDANVLARMGANNIILTSKEWWRLISAAFLHVGLIHLIVNMYSLAVIGSQVESYLGKFKFIFVYLVSAICGNLMSLVLGAENVVSVGASGAIFGLMGALLYFGYHYRLYLSDAIKRQIIPVIVINLVIGFVISGVDNAAHIGGLAGGFLAAMAVGISGKSEKSDIINGWIVLVLYIAFLVFMAFFR